jgi:hypothetical protein
MIGRGRLLGLMMPVTLLLVTPASAAVRAVFVGVDDYAFSRPAVPPAGFANLRGAVADTGRIKAALTRSLGLALDQPGADCRSQNAVSITLTNRCATRFALFADMKSALAGSAAGVLATAKVVEAGPTRARLQGEGAAVPLPAALFARELSHDFGSYRLPLAVRRATPGLPSVSMPRCRHDPAHDPACARRRAGRRIAVAAGGSARAACPPTARSPAVPRVAGAAAGGTAGRDPWGHRDR